VGHRPKRSLGQNFLVDGNLQRKIVGALEAGPGDEVLEIGPGRGALTRHLVGTVGRLLLVELDDELVRGLEEVYGSRPEVEVIHGDVLEVPWRERAREPGGLRVIGNIPYNLTTPILFHLLERPRPRSMLLMVQAEVADRIVAPAGTSDFGALSVGVRSVADVERVLGVPRTAFRPRPRVDSTVIRIRPLDPPPLTRREEEEVRTLTRLAFQWRRKQMQKILRDHPDADLTREQVRRLGREAGWDLRRRPETFSPAEFVEMARRMAQLPDGT
jgi:16S rRNA (adenine1518-N6/adenine1519-N6)-dimethyltransferase